MIDRNAQRLLKLVNTLLDFARLQSEQAAAELEPVELARYSAELAAMFDSAVARAGLTLTIDCPPLPAPVRVDKEMWAKVVLNLLSNALKFTFEGGITVRVDADGDAARLVVADTGIGISPADQERLFERFHRVADARSRSHEGSGIGLALVAELAEVHGGSVSVQSELGRGSSFTVRVPFAAARSTRPRSRPARRWSATPRATSPRRCAGSATRGTVAARRPRPTAGRWSSSPTTTRTCATTSPRCWRRSTAW